MVLAIGGVDVNGAEGVQIALWRFLDISLGNAIGTFCQALVWPERPEKLLMNNLAASLRHSANRLNQSLLPIGEVNTEEKSLALSEERIMNSLAQWLTWLDNAEHTDKKIRNDHHDRVNLIGDINQIAIASQQSARASAYLSLGGQNARFSQGIRDRILEIQERCATYASAIENRAWTPDIEALPKLVAPVSETFIEAEGRIEGTKSDPTGTQSTFEGTLLSSAISAAEGLDSIADCVNFLHTEHLGPREQKPGRPDSPTSNAAPKIPLFQLEKATFSPSAYARINPTDLVAASKAALAALLAYVYLNTVDWPGGITAVVTAVLVSLDNYGAMIQKSVLRVAGAVVGGLSCMIVILLIIPNITSLAPYLVAVGAVCGLGAWVQTGSTRIAYTGLQIGLVAGLALASSHSPSVDLMPFRDRILGIFTGLGAVVLVYGIFGEIRARIWTVDNSAATLRLMAKEAGIGLDRTEPSLQKTAAFEIRYEIYRRISFGYRLLTEAGYEDWFSRHKERGKQDAETLSSLLDQIRAVQRISMSLVWNRLEFQRLSAPQLDGRAALESIGRTVPKIFESIATRIQNSEISDSRALDAVRGFSERLRATESVLEGEPLPEVAHSTDRNYHRLLRAQLGFYQQLEILLTRMAEETQEFSISGDRFSLLARIRGIGKA